MAKGSTTPAGQRDEDGTERPLPTPTTQREERAMETFFIEVGVSMGRPIVPDQRTAFVVIASDKGPIDAEIAAAQMVGATRGTMVTSTKIVGVEI